jgi:hypothetical protein
LDAQLFFKEHLYKAKKVLRHFYEDNDEDAYRMEYRVPSVVPTVGELATTLQGE